MTHGFTQPVGLLHQIGQLLLFLRQLVAGRAKQAHGLRQAHRRVQGAVALGCLQRLFAKVLQGLHLFGSFLPVFLRSLVQIVDGIGHAADGKRCRAPDAADQCKGALPQPTRCRADRAGRPYRRQLRLRRARRHLRRCDANQAIPIGDVLAHQTRRSRAQSGQRGRALLFAQIGSQRLFQRLDFRRRVGTCRRRRTGLRRCDRQFTFRLHRRGLRVGHSCRCQGAKAGQTARPRCQSLARKSRGHHAAGNARCGR